MLIVTPDSSCDVCMESYMNAVRIPHAIPCGHTFCGLCLNLMGRPRQCPLCRASFSSQDVRKLHVVRDPAGPNPDSTTHTTVPVQIDGQIYQFLDDISNGSVTLVSLHSAMLEARKTLLQLLQLAFSWAESLHRLMIQDIGEQRNDHTLRSENDALRRKLESNRQRFASLRDEIERLRWTIQSEIQGEASSVPASPFGVTGIVAMFSENIFRSDPFFPFDAILAFASVCLCIMIMFAWRFHGGRYPGQVQVELELCFKNSSCIMLNVANGTRLTVS